MNSLSLFADSPRSRLVKYPLMLRSIQKYVSIRWSRGWISGRFSWEFFILLSPFVFPHNYNIGQNKMEQQTPIPPKSRMKPREGQKHAIFPSLIWGGGGSRFSIYFVRDCSLFTDPRHPLTVCHIFSFYLVSLETVFVSSRNAPLFSLRDETKMAARETTPSQKIPSCRHFL